jgi:molybdopterin-containing oxidoreductase family membrane subunit
MLLASKLLLPVLAAAAGVGALGVWDRLVHGKANLAFGSYVPWGLWVGLYIWLVGLSGGAFLVAFLHYGAGLRALRRAARYAVPIALLSIGAGLSLVLLDLGQMGRFWTLYTRTSPTSVLGWMVWVYTAYALVLLAMLVAMARPRPLLLRGLAWAGLPLVVTFGGGEGALFGVLGAKPFWNSGILPVRFLFAAFLSGLAVVVLAVALFRRWPLDAESLAATKALRRWLLGFLALNIVVEFAEVSVTLYTGLPAVVDAYRLVLFGPYWWLFWGGQLAVGLAVPAALLAAPFGTRPAVAGLAGLGVVLGAAAAKQNIVLPGLAIPEFRTLPGAFVHPRLSATYFPSATEWLVAVGVVAGAALLFVVAIEVLPFLRNLDARAADEPAVRPLAA